MADISTLAALINGLVQNTTIWNNPVDVASLRVGGSAPGTGGSVLTQGALAALLTYGQTAMDSLTGDVTASGPGASAASLVATSNSTLATLSALVTANSLTLTGDASGTAGATTIASTIVTGKLLTGLAAGTNTPIIATNSILTALENLQAQVTAGSGANTTLSNLTSPTAFNQTLLPSANQTWNIGAEGNQLSNIFSNQFLAYGISNNSLGIRGSVNAPDGQSNIMAIFTQNDSDEGAANLVIFSENEIGNDATATASIYIETGNKTAGTGNSGNVVLMTGTSHGGSQGSIRLVDGSQGISGQVWTSKDTVGSGHWTAASSGTVTSVSVTSANGFAGTVATSTTTPAITVSTTVTAPVLAGNGTAISAASTTGTGSTVVLSASPTITGTLSAAAVTLSGALNMGSNQINNVAMAGSPAGTDATNVTYVSAQIASAINGLTWKGPVNAYSNTNVALTGGATLTIDSYLVQNDNLVILGNQTTASQNNVYTVSGIGSAYVLTAVTGSEAPTALGDAYLILDGTVYGNSAFQVNQLTPNLTFIQFAGPNTYSFTAPLSVTGNTVSLNYGAGLTLSSSSLVTAQDGSTVSINGSNQLYVPTSGITSTQLASASVTAAKLATVTDGVTTNQSGAGSTIQVLSSPLIVQTMVAGQSFTANTSYLVRMGQSTDGGTYQNRVYAADPSSAAANLNFWVIGIASSAAGTSAGGNISVTMLGSYTLASADTGFSSGTNGQAVWLSTSGALTLTAPSTSGYATVKVGTVQTTGSGTASSVLVNGIQLTGIN